MTNNLPPELAAFVADKVATGKFTSPDDVVTACIRNVYNREKEHAELERLLQEGMDDLDNGRVIEVNSDEELAAFFEDVKKRGRERLEESRRAGSS